MIKSRLFQFSFVFPEKECYLSVRLWASVNKPCEIGHVTQAAITGLLSSTRKLCLHDDVIKWKHFPRYRPFVRGIHRSPVNSRTKACNAELWCFLWSSTEQQLSKQSWGWWFETPSRPSWRHRNDKLNHCKLWFGTWPNIAIYYYH